VRPHPRDRDVLPRWRRLQTLPTSPEIRPLLSETQLPAKPSTEELDEKVADWAQNRAAAFAVDLVGSALVLAEPEAAIDAARFLLAESSSTTSSQRLLAEALLRSPDQPTLDLDAYVGGSQDRQAVQDRLRRVRAALKQDPRDVLAWLDLALAYTYLGLGQKASRAIEVALALQPDSRVGLRSASRLFVHLGEPDRALNALRRSKRTQSDPWLQAAEVAVSRLAGVPPKHARRSRFEVTARSHRPLDTAELAAAVATAELRSGKSRSAAQVFRKGLEDPTENAVAQAEWASRALPGLIVPDHALNLELGYEARARHYAAFGEWDKAVSDAWRWLLDEPFSTAAALFGSYVASIGADDPQEAERMARVGTLSNPRDAALRNNLAFSLVLQGRLQEAEQELRVARDLQTARHEPGLTATAGLLAYRQGDLARGRQLYLRAIELGGESPTTDPRWLALVWIFHAREQLLAGAPESHASLAAARDAAAKARTPEVELWLQRLNDLAAAHPAGA